MAAYADVSAVVIQGWLSRTPRLRGRRGASTLLRDATSAATIGPLLPKGVEINREAGDVDGVVSLVGGDAAALTLAADAVAVHLRRAIPGIELRAAQAEAPDYFIAYRAMRKQIERGAARQWQPAVAEVVFARPCEYCGVDPAADHRDVGPDPGDRSRPVCLDCAARLDAAGRNSDPRRAPGPEARIAGWLADAGVTLDFPDDFAALAGAGTHIATVYADGNRIGHVFKAIAERHDPSASKAKLAAGIDAATGRALTEAVTTVARSGRAAVVPHLVGGDDVLVSVAAADAWTFTQAYLTSFGSHVRSWLSESGLRIPGSPPSASAGVVFHHRDHPFPMAVEQADAALALAKREFRGEQAAVAWADVSAEGRSSAAGSDLLGPRPLSWFATNAERLRQLAAVRPAQRYRLLRLTDDQLPEQVRRMGIEVVRDLHREGPDELRTALRVARWMQGGSE